MTSAPRPAPHTEPSSRPGALPEPPSSPHIIRKQPKARPATLPVARVHSGSISISKPASKPSASGSGPFSSQASEPSQSKSKSKSKPSKASEPAKAAPVAQPPLPPFVQLPNGGASFDPLALPLPPELAPTIYSWLRRLALQAELAGADRLLRDALADLTSSLSVVVIYAGPDGFYTLGTDDELPKDLQALTAVGKSRRALVATHTGLVPIATPNETIAVIQLSRNSRQPAFTPADLMAMAAVGREAASVMHHLVVEHLQRKTEAIADKASLYRPEALESHRKRGTEGVLAELQPKWIRRAYPMLVVTIVSAIAFATLVKVPTYSTGDGIVSFPGTMLTAPSPGTVDKIIARVGDKVVPGQLLMKLSSQKEDSDFEQANTEAENAQRQYLFDSTDEQVRKSLVSALAAQRHAQQSAEQRKIRATTGGVVMSIPVDLQKAVNFGEPLILIADRDTKPLVKMFMPGNDKPRLAVGQDMQIELKGYQKGRVTAKIKEIRRDAIGGNEVRNQLGANLSDAVAVAHDETYTMVIAELPDTHFNYHHDSLAYANGMQVKGEVKIESKAFLVTLLPNLEKFIE